MKRKAKGKKQEGSKHKYILPIVCVWKVFTNSSTGTKMFKQVNFSSIKDYLSRKVNEELLQNFSQIQSTKFVLLLVMVTGCHTHHFLLSHFLLFKNYILITLLRAYLLIQCYFTGWSIILQLPSYFPLTTVQNFIPEQLQAFLPEVFIWFDLISFYSLQIHLQSER